MISRRSVLAAAGLGLAGNADADESDLVRILQFGNDYQTSYMQQLMVLALGRSSRAYRMQPVSMHLVQSRALIELIKPEPSLDVFWTITDANRERRGPLVVRIPIDRGLLGWRIALVRRSQRNRWKQLRTQSQLALYSAVQVADWSDTAILRANGLPVETTTYYDACFEMLARGQVDYFPRSIMEIGGELESHRNMDLVIEPHLLLHYPSAQYFFVSPARPRLAADLEKGLESLVADGTVRRMFHETFGNLVDRYDMKQRVTLMLNNPLLSPQTPLQRTELWWSPKEG